MKKITLFVHDFFVTTTNNSITNSILTNTTKGLKVTLVVLAFLFNTASAQVTIDGNNCPGEWSLTADAVDQADPPGVPSSSDISRVWFQSNTSDLMFAFTRKANCTGDASFSVFIDSDLDASTGDLDHNGADMNIFFNLSTGTIINKELRTWNSVTSKMVVNPAVSFDVAVGDSTCAGSCKHFFEMSIGLTDILNPCDINGSQGSIKLVNIVAHAGQVFASQLVDTLWVDQDFFINTPPTVSSLSAATLCSGETLDLDGATLASELSGGDPNDSLTFAWDLDYNGTFSTDVTTESIHVTHNETIDSTIRNYALIVNDDFGCADTAIYQATWYKLPTLAVQYNVDDNHILCEDFVWTYSTTTAEQYDGQNISNVVWHFPDGLTDYGNSVDHVYDSCFWFYANQDSLYAVATDVNGCTASAFILNPLPAELVDFKATRENEDAIVSWTTATEKNVRAFIVERSVDGQNFETVGQVDAYGNSNSIRAYQFVDYNAPKADLFYRLRIEDWDNSVEYSDIVTLASKEIKLLTVSPNPANSFIEVKGMVRGSYDIKIVNSIGQTVLDQPLNDSRISLAGVRNGQYLVYINTQNSSEVHRLIVVR